MSAGFWPAITPRDAGVLSRAHSFGYERSLRPCLAWCSRTRNSPTSLEGALVADPRGHGGAARVPRGRLDVPRGAVPPRRLVARDRRRQARPARARGRRAVGGLRRQRADAAAQGARAATCCSSTRSSRPRGSASGSTAGGSTSSSASTSPGPGRTTRAPAGERALAREPRPLVPGARARPAAQPCPDRRAALALLSRADVRLPLPRRLARRRLRRARDRDPRRRRRLVERHALALRAQAPERAEGRAPGPVHRPRGAAERAPGPGAGGARRSRVPPTRP